MDNSIFNTNFSDNGDGAFFSSNGENGSSVRFNNEGDIMAISCPENSPGGGNKGIVKVFQYSGASWSRLGDDSMLIGQQNQEQFGINMDINGKGNIIAIGGQGRPDPGGGSAPAAVCYVKVFEWDGTSWNQRGTTFDQPISCYFSLSISDDGNTVGFGDRYYESSEQYGSTYAHGTIRIYEWDGTNYVQKTNPDDFKVNSSRSWYTGTNFKMNKTGTKFVYSHYNGSDFRLIAYHKEARVGLIKTQTVMLILHIMVLILVGMMMVMKF